MSHTAGETTAADAVRWAAMRRLRSRLSKWPRREPVLMPLSRAMLRRVTPGAEQPSGLTPLAHPPIPAPDRRAR